MRKKIHPKGPVFSRIVSGMWRLDQWGLTDKELESWIQESIGLGVTTFDHADIYGDHTEEVIFGRALKNNSSLREKIELVTKCNICPPTPNRPQNRVKHYNSSPEYITRSVEQSLKNLNTDYIDLLLLHRPDPLLDAGAAADALSALIEQEKIGYAGVSNFTPSQFDLLQSRMDHPIVTNQVECSLLHTEPIFDGTLDQAQQLEASPMLWSPLGGGELFSSNDEKPKRIRTALQECSEKYDTAIDQVALAWLLALPCNSFPVIGTSRIDRLAGAVGSLNINLDRQDWFKLLEASQGYEVP